MSDAARIEVRDLTMAYGERVVQKDVAFTVGRGEIFVVMGDSGCGKSTLLRHMVGLAEPRSGDVLYEGEGYWTAGEDRREALKRSFGVLYQYAALFSSMSLVENVSVPLVEQGGLPRAEALAPAVRGKLPEPLYGVYALDRSGEHHSVILLNREGFWIFPNTAISYINNQWVLRAGDMFEQALLRRRCWGNKKTT